MLKTFATKAQAHPLYGDTVPHFEASTLVVGISNYSIVSVCCKEVEDDRILPENWNQIGAKD